jgi:hypothetical protein
LNDNRLPFGGKQKTSHDEAHDDHGRAGESGEGGSKRSRAKRPRSQRPAARWRLFVPTPRGRRYAGTASFAKQGETAGRLGFRIADFAFVGRSRGGNNPKARTRQCPLRPFAVAQGAIEAIAARILAASPNIRTDGFQPPSAFSALSRLLRFAVCRNPQNAHTFTSNFRSSNMCLYTIASDRTLVQSCRSNAFPEQMFALSYRCR